jgi:hypothetical protein
MKKLYIVFIMFFTINAFALVTENIVNGCNSPTHFHPVFQINSYTCDNGYFLPADTLGCQPCPTGHTCNGGTFNYHPTKSQGIIFTRPTNANIAKSCSTNFGTVFVPIFEPKSVAVNFNDGVGNTETKTCTYDGLVNLPAAPPERKGYIFNGWKLAPNQQ